MGFEQAPAIFTDYYKHQIKSDLEDWWFLDSLTIICHRDIVLMTQEEFCYGNDFLSL